MKVFLSWSGTLSHHVACEFRDWLPSVMQSLKPYVSSEDIDKGTRWSSDIAKELFDSKFGILFITRENVNAPWIAFEAGALSRTIDKSYVAPFLVDIKNTDLVDSPLLQFQNVVNDPKDLLRLLKSINSQSDLSERLDESVLEKSFEKWWPDLDRKLKETISAEHGDASTARAQQKSPSREAVMEEILDLLRSQQRLLRSPEALLPPDYVASLLHTGREFDFERVSVQLNRARMTLKEMELDPVLSSDKFKESPLLSGLRRATRLIDEAFTLLISTRTGPRTARELRKIHRIGLD